MIRTNDADGNLVCWEPFCEQAAGFDLTRNLYKSMSGGKLQFEEVNHSLGLVFRYSWECSDRFGFVRSCHLANVSEQPRPVSMVDGLQNILPYGIDEMFQLRFSNLINAYKKNELSPKHDLGIFYLSSIPTDCAEPSEGLRATVAWQVGLDRPTILLSTTQLDDFRHGRELITERDVRGQRGAYLVNTAFELSPNDVRSWSVVADLKYDQSDVAELLHQLEHSANPLDEVRRDIASGQETLRSLLSAADGFQLSEKRLRVHRHQSNVIFNLMRGGTPFQGYDVCVADFVEHVATFNREVAVRQQERLAQLNRPTMPISELLEMVQDTHDPDLIRITQEYLPFTFGRRHGDPTRPWNAFSINWKNEDGTQRLNYQGNWRDIFQNWEALGFSYPAFLNSMVLRFVNASTADGYNPYRLTKDGFDWEKPEPGDPWANIGYWGDHQIIYLQKLLEWSHSFFPDGFKEILTRRSGVYAELPYRIRSYREILQNPFLTINYDQDVEAKIESRVNKLGADGRLLTTSDGEIHRVSLMEKLLVPAVVKMSNFVPGGGIWLNTQRPEWNDANNALVGNGASVVTVCHLRRFLDFFRSMVAGVGVSSIEISQEFVGFLENVETVLQQHASLLEGSISDQGRRQFVDQMQQAGEDFRTVLYQNGVSGQFVKLEVSRLARFAELCVQFLDQTIRLNRRGDGLFHSYNLLRFEPGQLRIEYLYEMLEGQVAALSSQLLAPAEVIEVLESLRNSKIYREDLNSYMLYPDRELPKFLEKNCIERKLAENSELIQALIGREDRQIVRRDVNGQLHFNGDLRNAQDLSRALSALAKSKPDLAELIALEKEIILDLFEQTFDHRRFTGRSGTFFGYEGLGCVYWHMVSKLALAVLECYDRASQTVVAPEQREKLAGFYREIRDGLGLENSPASYGAFPIESLFPHAQTRWCTTAGNDRTSQRRHSGRDSLKSGFGFAKG